MRDVSLPEALRVCLNECFKSNEYPNPEVNPYIKYCLSTVHCLVFSSKKFCRLS